MSLNWPSAHGQPLGDARLKSQSEDFCVREILNFTPKGTGAHAYLRLRKRGLTTEDVLKRMRRLWGLAPVALGYAGLKDRHAITEQWISVDLQGRAEPDWHMLEDNTLNIVEETRHTRKLKIGALTGNEFEILARDFTGDTALISARIEKITQFGVPNYFGEQRFGRNGENVEKAEAYFMGGYRPRDKFERGMLLSSARSWIFNHLLSERVTAGTWNAICSGDVMMLAGSHSVFRVERADEQLTERLRQHDIHPTGPLWGAGMLMSADEVAVLENTVSARFPLLTEGLCRFGLTQDRRRLVLTVDKLSYQLEPQGVRLRFALEAGAYATTVLREIFHEIKGE